MRIERTTLPKTVSVDSKADAKKSRGAEFRLQQKTASQAPATAAVSAQHVIARQAAPVGSACEGPYSKLPRGNDSVVAKLQTERRSMITASLDDLG